ncbi:serine--tRNA ligase, partial [Dehalococcoidia bacterium]|nr:serine--tRNA ligase [Dehalococcoidia bacterium]
MVSIQFIRQDHGIVREALARRNDDAPLDEILRLDSEHRKLLQEIEGLRARRNEVSKELGRMKEMLPELIADMRQVGERIKALEQEETRLSEQLTDMLLRIPNIPHPSVPLGRGETDNVVVRSRG